MNGYLLRRVCVGVISLTGSFWFYGGCRTLVENFGFNFLASLKSFVLTGVVVVMFSIVLGLGIEIVCRNRSIRYGSYIWLIILFSVSGSTSSEFWILRD